MALTLLNPGFSPLGMFDLDDADQGALVGGEYVEMQAAGVDLEAADVTSLLDAAGTLNFIRAQRTAGNIGGLADEGSAGDNNYGTLFGSLIGTTAGLATNVAGFTVIGPSTDMASGKVTVWAQAGLYGVSNQNANLLAAAANAVVESATTGILGTGAGGDTVAIYVGDQLDPSLVSTTAAAATGTAAAPRHSVIFYTGNAQA
jgi:hypothetical protein